MSLFKWDEFVDSLLTASGVTEAKVRFDQHLKSLGIPMILYADFAETDQALAGDVYFLDNFPKEWMDLYIENQYNRFDPIAKRCLNSVNPVIWSDYDKNEAIPKIANRMKNERIDCGLNQGVSFGLHHATNTELAVLSLALGYGDSDFERFIRTVFIWRVSIYILSSRRFQNKVHYLVKTI